MKTSNETRVVAAGAFVLALPAELTAINPVYVIDLPQKHTAQVFETTVRQRIDEKTETVPAYRVLILNSKGRRSNKVRTYGTRTYGDGTFTRDQDGLLDMKLALEAVANELTPKTTRSTSHYEIDEDD